MTPIGNLTGSLILGGVDQTRFNPTSTISVPFQNQAENQSPLLVSITSVTLSDDPDVNTTQHVAEHAIQATIDSSTPYIWLPTSACVVFERNFGIVWDERTELYLLNYTTHDSLRRRNATVIFSLQWAAEPANSSLRKVHNFTLTYGGALDLTISEPMGTLSPYFPLKRSNSTSEAILGRTFLQETHIAVDYERKVWNLSQAVMQPASPSKVVPILPNLENFHGESTPNQSPTQRQGLTGHSGAIAGIVVGCVVFMWVCSIVSIALWRKESAKRKKTDSLCKDGFQKPELGNTVRPWVEAFGTEISELEASSCHPAELEVEEMRLECSGESMVEMSSDTTPNELDS
jgi:hypothetical protein